MTNSTISTNLTHIRQRIHSIDAVRGLVIIFMVLDHVRDLIHTKSLTEDPTNLDTTSGLLFMTRWVTHLCAPAFVLLAGVSAYLSIQRSADQGAARQFLRKRGLWLILLELTVVGLGIWFDLQFRTILFQVIFAIGFGLVLLSFLSRFDAKYLGYAGLAIIFLHNLIPQAAFQIPDAGRFLWALFFSPGMFPLNGHTTAVVLYPVVPWFGIMLFGYSLGHLFLQPAADRKRQLLMYAIASIGVLVLFRTFNFYGDAAHWSPQKDLLFSFLSFINLTKYPPSLLYVAATLGVMFFVLWWMDGRDNFFTRFLSVYGQAPLFFYIAHWYVVHTTMFIIIILQGVSWSEMQFGTFNFGRPATGVGLELWGVYLVWLSIVALFYPLCKWYGNYKKQHPEKLWLRYL